MAAQQKRILTPKVFTLGVDITEDRFNELVLKIGDWFAEWRPGMKEPNVVARQYLSHCLAGTKPKDGSVWFYSPNTIEGRVAAVCRYDIVKMTPLRSSDEETKRKKAKAKEQKIKRMAKKADDPFIDPAVKKELPKSPVVYGDNPNVFLSSAESERFNALKTAYQEQFPELRSVNAEAELNALVAIHIRMEREQMKLLAGKAADVEVLGDVAKTLADLKKALGIHPEQLAKRVKEQTGGSMGEASAKLEALGPKEAIKLQYQAEEWMMYYQMFHSPRADGLGYQLDEPGLFALTGCRTCECEGCGKRNFNGFLIEEVEAHLFKTGHAEIDPAPEAVDLLTMAEQAAETEETDAGADEA